MTIQQLQYLIEVSRTGSITKAAKNLYVAQSSVSNAISALEGELGFPIFSRTWRGVEPTKEGQKILTHAVHIMEHHRQMMEKDNSPMKTVQIESSTYLPFCNAFVRTAEYYRDQRDLTFFHKIFQSRHIAMDRLAAFESDLLMVGMMHVSEREFIHDVTSRNLTWKTVKSMPGVVLIGTGHRFYNKPDLSITDLRDDFIIDVSLERVRKIGTLRAYLDLDPKRIMISGDRTARYEMASLGLGYLVGAALPERVERQYGFRSIPIPGLRYHMVSVTNPAQPLKPEVQRCLDFLQEELSEL